MVTGERSEAAHGKGSGSEPAVASMVESIVGCKWSMALLQLCVDGKTRPSAFLRECTGLSAKVLNQRLRKLTRYGILRREVCGDKPPVVVHYRLTPFGRRFARIVEEVKRLQEDLDAGSIGPSDERAESLARQERS